MVTNIIKRTHQYGPDAVSHLVDIYYADHSEGSASSNSIQASQPQALDAGHTSGHSRAESRRKKKKAIVFIGGGGWQGFDHFHDHEPLAHEFLKLPVRSKEDIQHEIASQLSSGDGDHATPSHRASSSSKSSVLSDHAVFVVLHHRPGSLSSKWICVIIAAVFLIPLIVLSSLSLLLAIISLLVVGIPPIALSFLSAIMWPSMCSNASLASSSSSSSSSASAAVASSSSSTSPYYAPWHSAACTLALGSDVSFPSHAFSNLAAHLPYPGLTLVAASLARYSASLASALDYVVATYLSFARSLVDPLHWYATRLPVPYVLSVIFLYVCAALVIRFVASRMWHLGGPGGDVAAGNRLAVPGLILDTASGVRALQDLLPLYGADPCEMMLVGNSSGAHIASLLAFDPRWLTFSGVHPLSTSASLAPAPALQHPPRPPFSHVLLLSPPSHFTALPLWYRVIFAAVFGSLSALRDASASTYLRAPFRWHRGKERKQADSTSTSTSTSTDEDNNNSNSNNNCKFQ